MADTRLLGIDWGTSSLRVYRIGTAGRVLERRRGDAGILRIADGAFEEALRGLAGDWIDASDALPLVACGMITSRHGWVETPYLPCPAGLEELARELRFHRLSNGRSIAFVAGVRSVDAEGVPDFMRGEETQVLGALEDRGTATLLLPGTHSKRVRVEAGRIRGFTTALTGELYGVLRRHSILGRGMEGDGFDRTAFELGVRRGAAGDLPHLLFTVRSLGLAGALPPAALPSYLSGLLIGAELAGGPELPTDEEILLVGEPHLCDRYATALERLGHSARRGPEDAAARGLWRIARQAGLLPK